MAYNVDYVNAYLQTLSTKLEDGSLVTPSLVRTPLFKALLDASKIEAKGGRYRAPISEGSTVVGGLSTGAPISYVSPSNVVYYEEETVRMQLPLTVDGAILDAEDMQPFKLSQTYIVETYKKAMQNWEQFLLNGAVKDVRPVLPTADFIAGNATTLNGAVTLANGNGGILQCAVAASQSGNVHGVARDDSWNHVNQYGEITSFAADGIATLERVLGACRDTGGEMVGFADPVSFSRLLSTLRDNVRTDSVDKDQGSTNTSSYIVFNGCKIYSTPNLDTSLSAWAGTTAESTGGSEVLGGCIMLIPINYFSVKVAVETKAKDIKLVRHPNYDKYVALGIISMQPMIEKLSAFGIVAGSRIP